MEFREFLRTRREQLGISQAELAERLSERGEEASSARVGHWETGRNKPPLEDLKFRQAIASALEIDVNKMMIQLGFVILDVDRSTEARQAADIIDALPETLRSYALEYLHTFERQYRHLWKDKETT